MRGNQLGEESPSRRQMMAAWAQVGGEGKVQKELGSRSSEGRA